MFKLTLAIAGFTELTPVNVEESNIPLFESETVQLLNVPPAGTEFKFKDGDIAVKFEKGMMDTLLFVARY